MTARVTAVPLSTFEMLQAVADFDDIFELGELVPARRPCGRRRHFPGYMYVLYAVLMSHYKSCRQVETELGSSQVWSFFRDRMRARFASEPSMWLPDRPMRRHHYSYMRDTYFVEADIIESIRDRYVELATARAKQLGMFDPNGGGSLTHPSLDRVFHGDGKVVTPLYRAKPGSKHVDPDTGEVRLRRCDPDAHWHTIGSGEQVWGTKFVFWTGRLPQPHSRIVLDVAPVREVGGEARVALDALRRIAPHLPGAQGVLYDGAFQGVHIQAISTEFGLLPIVPVRAKAGGRRARKPREESVVLVQTVQLPLTSGLRTVQLYARAGAIGIGELDDEGEMTFRRLERVKNLGRRNVDGTHRLYSEYRLPPEYESLVVRVPIYTTAEDEIRGFNRAQYVRAIPMDEPEFEELYSRRSDSESLNRALDDSLWLRRAHSKGDARQLFEMLAFGLMTNAVSVHRHRRRLPQAA